MTKWILIIVVDLFALGFILGIIAERSHAQGPTVSPMYTLSIERLDFAATDQQVLFQTGVPARSNFVEVFKNGLLETEAIDYSKASVTGHLNVTFLAPLGAGERVTLIYWR